MADRITLNRKLPVVEGDWDAGAAKRRIFAKHTNAEGELDAEGAADFFFIGDPDTGLKEDLHLPVGDIREGRSVIVASALRAVRSRLAQAETLPGVAADVKERANDIAGAMLEEHRGRKDALATVDSWSTGVMLPIPAEVAAMFPAREGHTPHITLVHAPWTSPEQTAQILEIVASELGALLGEEISLGELGYFERFADRVAFVRPEVTAKVKAARDRIAKQVADLGIEVSRLGSEWNPHATLDVVERGLNFVGTLPTGTWTIDDVEVWHDDERRSVVEAHALGLERAAEAQERADAQAASPGRRAAAVITTPKTMVEILRADTVELIEALPGPDHHPDGWIEYSVTYSRAGNIQVYDDVREYRPRDEVFAQKSMDSGRGNPWELRHSSELLSPRTVLSVARGCMRTFEKHPDGNHTWGRAKAWDQGLLDAVTPSDDGLQEAFAPQVSLAYRILADRRPGHDDDNNPFDQIATNIIINSLAAEPKGKGGSSVRVHADSVDRANVVTRADAMLELASGVPSGTVYWDPASWVRYDGGQRESKKDENTTMMKLFQKMLEARGLTGADAAAQLGIEVSEFEAVLADPSLLTDEMVDKLAVLLATDEQEDAGEGGDPDQRKLLEELVRMMGDPKMDRATRDAKARAIFDQMVPPGEGKPPKADPPADDPKREDGEDVEIDGKKVYVPAVAAAEIKKLREQGSGDGKRADAAEKKLADSDMIPRSDAAAMALEQGMVIGDVISLARASYGLEFGPEAGQLGALESLRPKPRKDKDGEGAEVEVPVIIREDWELAALKGAFGDTQGSAEFERIANASAGARPELMAMRLDDASKVVASRAHKGDEVLDSIARMRAAHAEAKGEDRDRADGDTDEIADAIDQQHKVAGATRHAT